MSPISNHTEALDIARKQCVHAPCDVDAHSMCLTLLLSGTGPGKEGARSARTRTVDKTHEIVQRCCDILWIVPTCEQAVKGKLFLYCEIITGPTVDVCLYTYMVIFEGRYGLYWSRDSLYSGFPSPPLYMQSLFHSVQPARMLQSIS